MWAWHEKNNADSVSRSEELFKSASLEFEGIDNKVLRQNLLSSLESAKDSVSTPIPA